MSTAPPIGFISLGCPQATVGTEQIITQLRSEGYGLTAGYDEAELVVINTCGYLESAVDESLDVIEEVLKADRKVIVTGCLGSHAESIQPPHPNIVAITGPHDIPAVMSVVHQHQPASPYTELLPSAGLKLTPSHYAYLKISEGCHHSCRFCVIPRLRGTLHSRPVGNIMEEAQNLVDSGVRELFITSQDVGAYGVDLNYRTGFWGGRPIKSDIPSLAAALAELGVWVRLHSIYPDDKIDSLLPMMAEGKILPYLDIPFQHASSSLLRQMGCPVPSEGNLERIQKWRAICPDVAINASFISGFPGETERDIEMLMEFLEAAQLDRISCQPYSPVEGAAANHLADQVDEELKIERAECLLDLQASITATKLAGKVGSHATVLIDRVESDGNAIARTYADAPGTDSEIFVEQAAHLQAGDFVEVIINHATEYELYGKPANLSQQG